MFIDFVTLTLINMVGGLVILAWYVIKGLDDPDQAKWAPAFAVPGLIAFLNGLNVSWNWPLPGSYNVAYGDLSVLFGILFLGTAATVAMGKSLIPMSIYAFFAGLASILVGVAVIKLKMTLMPLLCGVGFILTGLAGVSALPTLLLRRIMLLRVVGALVLVIAVVIWAINGYGGYWMHLQGFSKWVPLVMGKH